MLPSEILRQKISEKYNLPLDLYAWGKDLEDKVFSSPTDPDIEEHIHHLGEAYLYGCNIGSCGLTSRYLSRNIPNTLMHIGTCKIIAGTEKSPNGNHAWVETESLLLDPTLMIALPLELKEAIGYKTDKILDKHASTILSEYDTYEQRFQYYSDEYLSKITSISEDDKNKGIIL